MPRKKITGIRLVGRGNYAIDRIVVANGKRVHVFKDGFTSVAEASAAMEETVASKLEKSVGAPRKAVSMHKLIGEYAEWREMKGVRTSTVEGLTYGLTKFVEPRFPKDPYEALTYENVLKWYSGLVKDQSVTGKRKNFVFSEFRRFLEYAWKIRKIISSEAYGDLYAVVDSVKMCAAPKKEKQTWSAEQESEFFARIPRSSRDFPMFSLFFYLGCRIGEFIGLKWDAYDREAGRIEIKRQVIVSPGGPILTEELKTDESYRVDELDEETKAVLDDYMDSRDRRELAGYMFPSPYDPMVPLSRTWFRRKLDGYADDAGLPHISPHGVRHAKATAFMSVCENMQEVKSCARFLGHSATMMADVYAHVKGISQTEIIGRLKSVKRP